MKRDIATVEQLGELSSFDQIIDVRSPGRVCRGPHPGVDQLSGTRQPAADRNRHPLQAGVALRGQEAWRGLRVHEHRQASAGTVSRPPEELAPADRLLARRPAQRRHDLRLPACRLGRAAAGRRLQGLSPTGRRSNSPRYPGNCSSRSSAAPPAAPRAAFCRPSGGAGSRCSTSRSSPATRARCWASCPTRGSRHRRCSSRNC
jgi:hypothetical protein